jgi:branched-chain amino acid aminotransferase
MKESCGKCFILNGELKQAEKFDNALVYKGESIYEVIRTAGGIPLFFNDHISRLENSIKLQGRQPLAERATIKNDIIKLCSSEKRKEINIKLVFNYGSEGENNYLVYFIDSSYPTPAQYANGVKAILYFAERTDPEAKVLNYRLRSSVHQELVNEGAYEALLVNGNNLITEGSRSNVFFLKGGKLITAPDNMILRGITRKHVLDICRETGTEVVFDCVNADDLRVYEAAFLTGTSPMVLPLSSINELRFNTSHKLMQELRELYVKRAEESRKEF